MVRNQTLQFLKRSFANNVSWTKASPDCRYGFEVIGVDEFRPEFKITAHSHPYYEVGLGLVGSGALLLGKETKTVKPGDLYIIEPGITHRVSALQEGTFAVFIFQVTLESKKSEQPSNSIPGIVGSSLLVESEIEKMVLSWAEINVGKSQDPVSLSLFARCLAFEMLSLLSVSSKIGDWTVPDRAIKYIEESLPGKFDVSTMATDLMVSQRTLRRHFQNENLHYRSLLICLAMSSQTFQVKGPQI